MWYNVGIQFKNNGSRNASNIVASLPSFTLTRSSEMDTSIVDVNPQAVKTTFIYALVDPFTDAVRYVGKADDVQRRLRGHINEAKRGKRDHKNRWIASLLSRDARPQVRILESCGDNWKERETWWITELRAVGCGLTNSKSGGDGLEPTQDVRRKLSEAKRGKTPHNKGKKASEEARRKMSLAAKARFAKMSADEKAAYTEEMRVSPRASTKGRKKLTPEHKEKLRLANMGNKYTLGRHPSLEEIEKSAAAHRGKPKSEETKRKISEAHLRRREMVPVNNG